MKLRRQILDIFYLILVPLIAFIGFEIYLLEVVGYKTVVKGNRDCKIDNLKRGYSTYKENCQLSVKKWENDNFIDYKFNEFGRRDGTNPNENSSQVRIAALGGSFTLGNMVPIDDSYSYYAFNKNNQKKYIVHNFGVTQETFQKTFKKLKFEDFNKYDVLLYSVSPNYFFELLSKKNKEEKNFFKQYKSTIFGNLRSILNSRAVSRFVLGEILKNDKYYYEAYLSRKPYSNYLRDNLDNAWLEAVDLVKNDINQLPESIKRKLKIVYLPQRVEVVGYRLGKENLNLAKLIKEICDKNQIDFLYPNMRNLSNIKSHFIMDGHLTIEGNHSIGNDIEQWSLKW